MNQSAKKVIILGAGPAGLAAGFELCQNNIEVVIIEKENKVGGMSRTEEFNGNRFDLAPHRFFTKNKEIKDLWRKMLGVDFVEVSRLTRIYYKKRFFYYPLKFFNALKNLGFFESIKIVLSFSLIRFKRIFKDLDEVSFEDWVVKRFGRRLFDIFFKSYTEKLWGIDTKDLSAEWAAQRIKSLSLSKALKNLFFRSRNKVKSLIDKFYYPKFGAGMMYEKMADFIKENGGKIILESEVISLKTVDHQIISVMIKGEKGEEMINGDYFISTLPINKLIKIMEPAPPAFVLKAADDLKFRSLVYVAIQIEKENLFPDNWLYIQDPEVMMTRLTNFRNWSKELIHKDNQTVLGLEYACWEGDIFWKKKDGELLELAKKDLMLIGLVSERDIKDGRVFRMADAYPSYAFEHNKNLPIIVGYLKSFVNLQTVGRGGMFRYNNMDHSIWVGLLAARKFLGSAQDPWLTELDDEFFEEEKKQV